jgi:hypothetical protein
MIREWDSDRVADLCQSVAPAAPVKLSPSWLRSQEQRTWHLVLGDNNDEPVTLSRVGIYEPVTLSRVGIYEPVTLSRVGIYEPVTLYEGNNKPVTLLEGGQDRD